MTETQVLYMGANGFRYLDKEMAEESIKRQLSENQRPATQKSLEDYPRHNAEKELLAIHQRLNSDQKARHSAFLQGLDAESSAAWKKASGDGKRSRDSLRPGCGTTTTGETKMPKVNPTVAQALQNRESLESQIKETFGFATDEMAERVADLLEQTSCRNKLLEMFDASPELKLLFNEQHCDAAQALADRIHELEYGIEILEQEQEWLLSQERLSKDVIYDIRSSSSSSRRRSLSEDFATNDEGTEFGEPQHRSSNDPMARRLELLERTLRNTTTSTPASVLQETWKITN